MMATCQTQQALADWSLILDFALSWKLCQTNAILWAWLHYDIVSELDKDPW